MTRTDQPEIQWIIEYKKGDVAALEQLVEHFRKPLYAFIYNMLQGRGDAEEIFQEVWLRAIKNMHAYRDKNFCGWLFRIAHNLFIDRVRREKRMVRPAADHDPDGEINIIEQFPSRDILPDEWAADNDLGLRIRHAVAGLPDDQREVFLMRTEADIPFKEIAVLQETTLNTVLSRMQYALQKLRPLLQEDYNNLNRGV